MRSLFRIATAHGTTQQALLGRAAGQPPGEAVREDGTSRLSTLQARDSITYAGRVEHRFRQVGQEVCVVLLVHSGPADA
jgi:hypothetical protein